MQEVSIEDAETFWRVECLLVWFNAVSLRYKASRDYADWLAPYLKDGAFQDPSYKEFWLQDVKSENVPLNRLTGLVGYYQTKRKITHGNAADQIHASHILDADLFVTADTAFHGVLLDVQTNHFPQSHCRIALVERGASSAVAELCRVLDESA